MAVNPGKRSAQARDATRKTHIASIATALETYYTTHGSYPTDPTNCPPNPDCWGASIDPDSGIGKILISAGEIKNIPKDPNEPNTADPYHNRYNYGDKADGCWGISGPGTGIAVWTWLEDTNDKDITKGCNPNPYTEPDSSGKARGLYMYVSGKKLP